MRYQIQNYESANYFGSLDCFAKGKKRITRVNSNHTCAICNVDINKGMSSLYLEKVWKGSGWFRCWICEDCCNSWLEATHQIEKEGNVK